MGRPPRTVLFVQHAPSLGGSCTSLRDMLRVLDRRRFRPVIALARPTPEVARFHQQDGIEVILYPGIRTFEHTTAFWTSLAQPASLAILAGCVSGWSATERHTLALVNEVRPDLVHLNSVVLLPSARALYRAGVPFVWHVREMPVPGYFGLRRWLQRRALCRWPDEAVYLSEVARRTWTGEASGCVIPEFLDRSRFETNRDRRTARRDLGIDDEAKVVLYLGGLSVIKGIVPLVEALALVNRRISSLLCLMPGAEDPAPPTKALIRVGQLALSALGLFTTTTQLAREISRHSLGAVCRRAPFSDDIPTLIAASDVLVFPSTVDHFARPAVEAMAMERPVIASRFPMMQELIRDGETGILVPPGNGPALAEALLMLLSDPLRARCLGEAGRAAVLERFDAVTNTRQMMAVYDAVLGHGPGSVPAKERPGS